MIEIRQAGTDDAAWMQAGFDDSMGWKKAAGYFAGCYQLQEQGELVLLVAVDGENYVGHVKVMWQSAYAHFREQGIPEIQDLAVLPAYRRQAVAKQLVLNL